MNRTELLEIVGKAEMAPLIDQEETPGVQVGWYKMCHEPIPELDELRKNCRCLRSRWSAVRLPIPTSILCIVR